MKNLLRISGVILLILIIQSCKKDNPTPPVVLTNSITDISYTTATSGGDVTSEGGSPVTSRGLCWHTSVEPTIANSKTAESGGLGFFTSNLTQLKQNTLYYVRAYATNIAGTGYGNQVTFTTSQIELATLTTTDISTIIQTSAVSGGNITDDNGGDVTARGICWNTTENPTTENNKTSDGTGTGSFVSNLTGLAGNTTYYVRSYAINSAGTQYGNQVSFKTSPLLATLTTLTVSSITQTTATSGGNISDDGGATIESRGVCWSTSINPTTELSTKTADGNETGIFSSSIIGLTLGTTYYIRAYATNSVGTVYGNELSFATNPAVAPILTTTIVTSITGIGASIGGEVTSDGGATITARGVCWSTTSGPTIALNTKTVDLGTTGPFTSILTGLNVGTKYYVRAYASNSIGTTYGDEVSFTTLIAAIEFNPNLTYGSLTDIDGNNYKTIIIGSQTWMAENLKTTKYKDGVSIPLVTDNTSWSNLTTPGYCYYNNDSETYKDIYGAIYNYFTVQTNILCPSGWQVASENDWATLANYLGGETIAGGKLKETGINHFTSPNFGATNESGFTALPGGIRDGYGLYGATGNSGLWWVTNNTSINGSIRSLHYSTKSVIWNSAPNNTGLSVRCLKDN